MYSQATSLISPELPGRRSVPLQELPMERGEGGARGESLTLLAGGRMVLDHARRTQNLIFLKYGLKKALATLNSSHKLF